MITCYLQVHHMLFDLFLITTCFHLQNKNYNLSYGYTTQNSWMSYLLRDTLFSILCTNNGWTYKIVGKNYE